MPRRLAKFLTLAVWASAADADVIVDHQPYNTDGPASDTLLIDMFGTQTWQLAADDFTLATPASIQHVTWWGFYGDTFGGGTNQPPTGAETIRIRFYGSRASDGLPNSGAVLYEESLLNPSRTWTGRIIQGGTGAHEYLFDTTLASPVQLAAGTRYWMEIVQVGDVDSFYRWEISVSDRNGIAFLNPSTPDWQTTGNYSLAYQLSTAPEPAAAMLILAGCRMRPWQAPVRGGRG